MKQSKDLIKFDPQVYLGGCQPAGQDPSSHGSKGQVSNETDTDI